jgi:hypothetical protein
MSAWAIGGARSATVIALLTVLGCSSTMGVRGSADFFDAATPGPVHSRSILTRWDFASTNAATTIEAIEQLRPEFFLGHVRTPALGREEITVYLNDTFEGDISLLNTIPLREIREVTLLRPTEALFRFGVTCRCPGGVILVNTRRLSNQRP